MQKVLVTFKESIWNAIGYFKGRWALYGVVCPVSYVFVTLDLSLWEVQHTEVVNIFKLK